MGNNNDANLKVMRKICSGGNQQQSSGPEKNDQNGHFYFLNCAYVADWPSNPKPSRERPIMKKVKK